MTTEDNRKDEKPQYNSKRERQQKCQHYHLEKLSYRQKILPFNRRQIMEQAKFAYSPLRKA